MSLKLVTGNPGKRRLKQTPAPSPGKVACPDWLNAAAKAEWRRVAPELERLGLLTRLDRAVLAGYCEAYARWAEATKFIHENGQHYMTPKGQLRQWPQVETAKQAEQAMRSFASEFGLTPNSRAKLSVESREEEVDEFEKFLRRSS